MSTNNTVFFGRLGQNPDLRRSKKDEPYCFFSVAVNDDESNETSWKKVIVFGEQANHCKSKLIKGSQVFVHGQKQVRQYEDKDGNMKLFQEIKAWNIGFLNV